MPPLMTTADSDKAREARAADIALRVQTGMRFLDLLLPEGWERKINLDTLDVANGGACVCGQLAYAMPNHTHRGGLYSAIERCDYGFNSRYCGESDLLNAEWRLQILQRWSRMDRIAA